MRTALSWRTVVTRFAPLVAGLAAAPMPIACSDASSGAPADAAPSDAAAAEDVTAPHDASHGDEATPADGASDTAAADAQDATESGSASFQTTITNFDSAGNRVIRFDTAGNAVDAHDGQIAFFAGRYYLYGTSYDCGFRWKSPGAAFCGFKVYASTDLVHWEDKGALFDATTPTWQTRCNGATIGCFRPHVVFNAKTGLYVLWINVYDNSVGFRVFTSASPTGPFAEQAVPTLGVNDAAPPNQTNNGDHHLFVDKSGKGYLSFTDWRSAPNPGSLAIEELSDDYLTGTTNLTVGVTPGSTEAPALFERNGTYYLIYSDPNCGYCTGTGLSYRSAPAPLGPWSAPKLIDAKSCGGQPSFVSQIPLVTGPGYVFGSDLWTGDANEAQADYFWAPLSFAGDGSIDALPCPATVTLDLLPGAPGHDDAPPATADTTSGSTGFRPYCDLKAGIRRAQAFTATRTGTLTRVVFTTFQSATPTATLDLSIFAADAGNLPTGAALGTASVPASAIGWSSREVAFATNVPVAAGKSYAFVVSSNETNGGCFGMAYRDASPLAGTAESYSNDDGASFAVEANRVLKFRTEIQ